MTKKLLVKKQEKILPELTQKISANEIVTVGNDPSASLELKNGQIAPEQVVIVDEGEQTTLLCRAAGTRINGESLPQGSLHNLQLKDEIAIGDYTIIFDTEENVEAIIARNVPFEEAKPEAIKKIAKPKKNKRQKDEKYNPGQSLNDVLEGLRSEEKFYFLIENGTDEKQRVYVESEEMWLGWSPSGECVLTSDVSEIETPRAQIRKDWSGVVLYPHQPETIWLNDEFLAEPRRLRNDDRMMLLSRDESSFDEDIIVKFHEPTALLVLDSILPKELPPPVSLSNAEQPEIEFNTTQQIAANTAENIQLNTGQLTLGVKKKSRLFGYFTWSEILIMALGTLIAAAIIFLLLELF